MDSEAESRYSLLPSVKSGKYRETEGAKDYSSAASLTQYQVIPLEEDTPATYERVFKTSGNKVFPVITNDGGELTTLSDGRRQYSFSGGAGTGYSKSTITSPHSALIQSAPGSVDIYIYSASAFSVEVYDRANGRYESSQKTNLNISYTVSTPPTGGASGSVTVSPMSQYLQYAIKPAYTTGGGAQTKTFLVLDERASIQSLDLDDDEFYGNYAWDID